MSRSTSSWLDDPALAAAVLLHHAIERARVCPNSFVELCFTDPSGAPLRQGAVHVELQQFLSRHRRALVELPRDHGKSMQICARLLWELGRDPSLRVKVVCATEARAADRCRFLRDAVATNRRVRLVFPELRPAKPWEATQFTVRRPAEGIGPSVAGLGVGASSTGTRADLLVCDDLVDVKALHSRADRERVRVFFHENLVNLLEPEGRLWSVFTPWHLEDLNAVLKKNAAYALFRRPVGEDLEPVWPEKWSRAMLEQRRLEIGAVAFARAYRLVCVPDADVSIRPEWVRFWTEEAEPEMVLLSVDPAVSRDARADASALVTLARQDGVARVLEALARRAAAPDLVGLIDDADRRWNPDVILFESNAAFGAVRDLLVRHTRFGAKVRGVVQTRDKMSRMNALALAVQNEKVLLRGADPLHVHAAQQALFDEMTMFPFAEHDDLADALATGVKHLLEQPDPRVW